MKQMHFEEEVQVALGDARLAVDNVDYVLLQRYLNDKPVDRELEEVINNLKESVDECETAVASFSEEHAGVVHENKVYEAVIETLLAMLQPKDVATVEVDDLTLVVGFLKFWEVTTNCINSWRQQRDYEEGQATYYWSVWRNVTGDTWVSIQPPRDRYRHDKATMTSFYKEITRTMKRGGVQLRNRANEVVEENVIQPKGKK